MSIQKSSSSDLDANTKNFLTCIKTRKVPNGTIETDRNAAFVAHLGHIAYRTGKNLDWDDIKSVLTNEPAANNYLELTYRSPWKIWKG
ncbi:MAG: hypothetical protein ACI9DJ_000769 [Algoriphagus sp.]